ncbi:MAG: redox-regulated ATPase YchF [Deltaproteobacteria bacterium]|nr:redox-regulated ATPase YchF [Deltaproteobacteria bacterium]
MKLGIIGLPGAGKSTIFSALTGARGESGPSRTPSKEQVLGTVKVADERVDFLTGLYRPKKTTYAQVEYLLPSAILSGVKAGAENAVWNQVRACDALIHVIRNFKPPGGPAPSPEEDFWRLEEEMILNDMMVVEKRMERIDLDRKRGKKENEKEYQLLGSCRDLLETSAPIRRDQGLALAPELRGFTFLSAKPELVVINNEDDDPASPPWSAPPEGVETMVVRGRLEMDISSMSPEEAEEFLTEYGIEKTALDRVIRASYKLLNLISFFTVLNEEVRAWTITRGTTALDAAGTVHSDMKRGFIRAEVLSFQHLKEYGSFQEAKRAGQVRLEGKDYRVQDGDIINFRFNL